MIAQTSSFEHFFGRAMEMLAPRREVVLGWKQYFWQSFGMPDPQDPESDQRLSLLPLAWMLQTGTGTARGETPMIQIWRELREAVSAGEARDLPLQAAEAADFLAASMSELHFMPIERLESDGSCLCRLGPRGPRAAVYIQNWSPNLRATVNAVVGYAVPWHGRLYCPAGYATLNRYANTVMQKDEQLWQDPELYESDVLFTMRFATALFRYPMGIVHYRAIVRKLRETTTKPLTHEMNLATAN